MPQNVQKPYRTMLYTSLSIQISDKYFQYTLHLTSLSKHVYRVARAKETDTDRVPGTKKAPMVKTDLIANFFFQYGVGSADAASARD